MPTPKAPASSKPISWTVITLSFLAAAGWAVAWWRGSVASDQKLVLESVTTPTVDLRSLEDRIRALEFENNSLRAQVINRESSEPMGSATDDAGGRRVEGGEAQRGPGGPGGGGGAERFLNRLQNDPAFSQMLTAEATRRMEERYAGFIRDMRMPPDQARQFISLMAAREVARNTAWATARANGIDPRDRAAMSAYTDQLLEPINQSINSLLGEQGVKQMQAWETAAPFREQVQRLENRLTISGQPLQPFQRDALTQVLSSAQQPESRPSRNAGAEEWNAYFQSREAAIQNTIVRAQSVLSTQQVQELADLMNNQLNTERVRVEMQREAAAREAQRRAQREQQN